MNYENLKWTIILIGWPLLIAGSAFVLYRAYAFYKKMGMTPIAKLVPVFAMATVVTMYSLGFISTAFLISDITLGVYYVLPVFVIWFVVMVCVLYLAVRFNNQAVAYNDMMIEFNQAKDDFVAISSHQLRTPATGIRWIADLLLNDPNQDTKNIEKLKQIKDTSQKMLELISNLLNVVRIETGVIKLTKEKIQLSSLIKEVIKSLSSNIDKAKVTLDIKMEDENIFVKGDKILLAEAIKNLINNAISHVGPDKTVCLRLLKNSKNVLVEFENTGESISEDRQKTMFEKFSRERVENKNIIQDVGGLGLYITRRFVRLCEGDVLVRSVKGGCTTFTIKLKNK